MSDVLILGGGLAGLACACELTTRGVSCQILEASDAVGGRVRTDVVDGFLLDRGFQVLLTAYPEAQRQLDYSALQLRAFAPGALVRFEGRFHSVVDPWRRPLGVFRTLASPIGSLGDKVKVARLRQRVTRPPLESIFQSPDRSTLDYLRGCGFSSAMIERFFRPFFGGIFLERELRTSSRMFEFVFRMFSLGNTALPAGGMGAIPQQLLQRLPAGTVRLGQKAVKVGPSAVTMASGEELKARAVVVATNAAAARQLLPQIPGLGSRGTACFYFAAEKPPVSQPILVLNGDGNGPINNLCVPSVVAQSYAPAGAHLVSATVISEAPIAQSARASEQQLAAVQNQLVDWFGEDVRRWRHLRTDWIPDALPEQLPTAGVLAKDTLVQPGLYICGDHRETASINGALASGRSAADAVADALGNGTSS